MNKKLRDTIFQKFDGKCAYSGTTLEEDWQAEHIKPIVRNIKKHGCLFPNDDTIENIVPVQKLINHYKHSLSLEEFRNWYLSKLHLRLKNLPKNPKTEKSKRRKEYMIRGICRTIPRREDKRIAAERGRN
jgi:5-methylcytosine-specific restriction endonuclease McrA